MKSFGQLPDDILVGAAICRRGSRLYFEPAIDDTQDLTLAAARIHADWYQ